ncbi:uncharacterized protein PpBr36_06294 [Pyricularia pennisetigena]|uniref:uncharacterized protein n=1 Tax=Pyricularia pennisetigena TaxID=1578925 RepID=UPI0011547B47|nr:uncharacterized protein PpBr36_06294 [Pyricularia pennisetigena]TLS23719.1 hypothetical protein PpBr36_06294 [Pyricularia pennisetigena]
MASMAPEEQVKFLVTCIKHGGGGGKIDFAAVATELEIVSKAAAAKRYERLLKSYNIHPGSLTVANTPENTPKKKATPRKRKAADRDADNDDGGDDAAIKPASKKGHVAKREASVKDEEMREAADNEDEV